MKARAEMSTVSIFEVNLKNASSKSLMWMKKMVLMSMWKQITAEKEKSFLLGGPWPQFNEKEMLINLLDGCPCCLEVYQLIKSYSESVFFDFQAQGKQPTHSPW